jgi:hypothetical protein
LQDGVELKDQFPAQLLFLTLRLGGSGLRCQQVGGFDCLFFTGSKLSCLFRFHPSLVGLSPGCILRTACRILRFQSNTIGLSLSDFTSAFGIVCRSACGRRRCIRSGFAIGRCGARRSLGDSPNLPVPSQVELSA